MAEHILVKYDLDKFAWRDAPAVDGRPAKARLCAGAEIVQDAFNREMLGEQTLFFATYVDLAAPTDEHALLAAARAAWIWLRFHVPTIALNLVVGADDAPAFVYHTDTPAGVERWAEHTLRVERQDMIDLVRLREREDVGRARVPDDNGDITWMHIVPGTRDTVGRVSEFGLLLRTHHSPFDGTAMKIVLARFLGRVAERLGATDAAEETLEWGTESDNLLPSTFQVLVPEEPRPVHPSDGTNTPSFAHPYYAHIGGLLTRIQNYLEKPYGFRERPGEKDWPSTRHLELAFTQAETDSVLGALKKLDSSYTFTHLAVSALAMVVVQEHPPTAADRDRIIGYFGITNCRHRLAAPYASKDGYPGYALGISSPQVPVSLFLTESGAPCPTNERTLARVLRHVRDMYLAEKASPCQISGMPLAVDIFVAGLRAAARAGARPPGQGFSFSSDGLGEQYLDEIYCDASGRPVLNISRFFTSLNVIDPSPFFRTSSWKGVSELMVDYNSNVVASADVKGMLRKWKENILMVTTVDGTGL